MRHTSVQKRATVTNTTIRIVFGICKMAISDSCAFLSSQASFFTTIVHFCDSQHATPEKPQSTTATKICTQNAPFEKPSDFGSTFARVKDASTDSVDLAGPRGPPGPGYCWCCCPHRIHFQLQ